MTLKCDLGDVVDISGTGMRVKVKGKVSIEQGETFPLQIHAPEGSIRVQCKVIWARKVDWRWSEIGLQFDGITPETRAVLNLVARGIAAEGYVLRKGDQSTF
jgi:c-di-GMP-binding flagellar brake protein YcgR